MARLEIRPEAELDALEVSLWYEGEREGLGREFLDEIRATFVLIEQGPMHFPLVSQVFRRAILHRFIHLHRNPRSWQERE